MNVKTKCDEMNVYNALLAEIDEPLPSYDSNINNNMTTEVNNKDDPNIYNASAVMTNEQPLPSNSCNKKVELNIKNNTDIYDASVVE